MTLCNYYYSLISSKSTYSPSSWENSFLCLPCAVAFILAERLKEERLKAGLTQEQLAERIGTKKTYISRIENGKADVQLSTLFRIFQGLGKQVKLTIL